MKSETEIRERLEQLKAKKKRGTPLESFSELITLDNEIHQLEWVLNDE